MGDVSEHEPYRQPRPILCQCSEFTEHVQSLQNHEDRIGVVEKIAADGLAIAEKVQHDFTVIKWAIIGFFAFYVLEQIGFLQAIKMFFKITG